MRLPVTLVPIDKLASPEGKDLVQIYHKHWWIVDKEGNALFARGCFAQCNVNEKIAASVRDRIYPGHDLLFVETAFVPIHSNDFEHRV